MCHPWRAIGRGIVAALTACRRRGRPSDLGATILTEREIEDIEAGPLAAIVRKLSLEELYLMAEAPREALKQLRGRVE
jgi:hypothetical protein